LENDYKFKIGEEKIRTNKPLYIIWF
jgi:hypothetical protein